MDLHISVKTNYTFSPALPFLCCHLVSDKLFKLLKTTENEILKKETGALL